MSKEKQKEIELVAVKFYEPINLKGKISGFWIASKELSLKYIPDMSVIKLEGKLAQKEAILKDEVCLLVPIANVPEMIVKA